MTREQFHHLVNHPAGISEASAEQLPDLIRQFPYCQALRYLQLRYLSEKDSIHYPQQLKVTSAYAPDRGRLFRIIHPEPELLVVPEEEPAAVSAVEPSVAEVPDVDEAPASGITDIQHDQETVSPQANETLLQSLDEKLEQLDQWEHASGNLSEIPGENEAVKKPLVSPGLYIAPAETPDQIPELPETIAGSDDLDKLIREELIQQELHSLQGLTPAIQPPKENRGAGKENQTPFSPPRETTPSPALTAPPSKKPEILRPAVTAAAQPEPKAKPQVVEHEQEPIALHRGEIHSFSDWLKMGKQENPPQVIQPQVTTKPEPATDTTTSIDKDAEVKPAGKPRLIFSKEAIQHAPEGEVNISAGFPEQFKTTESLTKPPSVEHKVVNPAPTPSGPSTEERFDYELLPPRKPIPDPSDVDTEIPRSQVP
ncbi:MAG: hypothetical protein ACKORE_08970, partial [Bacteroidota bacterium]